MRRRIGCEFGGNDKKAEGEALPPRVDYTVDFIEGVWKVGLNGTHFGPYSTLDTAVAAASGAAHKAEAQGYEAFVTINSPPAVPADLAPEPERDAAADEDRDAA